MYIPPFNKEDDPQELLSFMQSNNFATLVSYLEGELIATPLPVTIEQASPLEITGHLARANPHCNAFNKEDSLLIFSGPHAYISPTLYEKTESVPTWNYSTVHAYGVAERIDFKTNPERLEAMLMQLVNQHEASYEKQWNRLSEKYKHGMMQGIVGFTMKITKLEGKYKLSQNKSRQEQKNVARALQASPRASDNASAEMMLEKLELY